MAYSALLATCAACSQAWPGHSAMANIPIGTKGEQILLVTSEVAIDFLGMEGARVLSTPHIIGFRL